MRIMVARTLTDVEAKVRPVELEQKVAAIPAGIAAVGTTQLIEADEKSGRVTAIVGVTGIVDHVDDLIVPGAYKKTLAKRRPKVCFNHSWNDPIGRVVGIEEWAPGDARFDGLQLDGKAWPKEAGALVATMEFNLKSDRARDAYQTVVFFSESGECEWSIGWNPVSGKALKRRDGIRVCAEVDLFEVSPVLFGAAPLTRTLSLKDASALMVERKSFAARGEVGERPSIEDLLEGKVMFVKQDVAVPQPTDTAQAPAEDEEPDENQLHAAAMDEIDWDEVTRAASSAPETKSLDDDGEFDEAAVIAALAGGASEEEDVDAPLVVPTEAKALFTVSAEDILSGAVDLGALADEAKAFGFGRRGKGGTWEEGKHPRDADGRFIESRGFISIEGTNRIGFVNFVGTKPSPKGIQVTDEETGEPFWVDPGRAHVIKLNENQRAAREKEMNAYRSFREGGYDYDAMAPGVQGISIEEFRKLTPDQRRAMQDAANGVDSKARGAKTADLEQQIDKLKATPNRTREQEQELHSLTAEQQRRGWGGGTRQDAPKPDDMAARTAAVTARLASEDQPRTDDIIRDPETGLVGRIVGRRDTFYEYRERLPEGGWGDLRHVPVEKAEVVSRAAYDNASLAGTSHLPGRTDTAKDVDDALANLAGTARRMVAEDEHAQSRRAIGGSSPAVDRMLRGMSISELSGMIDQLASVRNPTRSQTQALDLAMAEGQRRARAGEIKTVDPQTLDVDKLLDGTIELKVAEGGADRNRGNAENLRRSYEHGKVAAEIRWGQPGDFMRCVKIAGKHMTPDQAKGYCQLRHKGALGVYAGQEKSLGLQAAEALADTWNPLVEVGELAGAEPPVEVKSIEGALPGSLEERRDLVRRKLEPVLRALHEPARDPDAPSNPGMVAPAGCWIDIVGTWTDRVVATVHAYPDGEPPVQASYEVEYSIEGEDVILGEPEPVELRVTIEHTDGDDDGDGDDDEEITLEDLLPIADLIGITTAGVKSLMALAPETKAGRVLSGSNESRLRGAVEHLIAVLAAAGVNITGVENPGDAALAAANAEARDTTAPGTPAAVGVETKTLQKADIDSFLQELGVDLG